MCVAAPRNCAVFFPRRWWMMVMRWWSLGDAVAAISCQQCRSTFDCKSRRHTAYYVHRHILSGIVAVRSEYQPAGVYTCVSNQSRFRFIGVATGQVGENCCQRWTIILKMSFSREYERTVWRNGLGLEGFKETTTLSLRGCRKSRTIPLWFDFTPFLLCSHT